MTDTVRVRAMQDVTVMDGRGSRRLERGQVYELGRVLADDLARAGYVMELIEVEPEVAAVAAPERAVVKRGPRRKGGEL